MCAEVDRMIRIVVRTDDESGPMYSGAPVRSTLRTFDIAASGLVAFLEEHKGDKNYCHLSRTIVGVEVLAQSIGEKP